MKAYTYSFYARDTGEFTGRQLTVSDRSILRDNTPEGCEAIEGTYCKRSQRYDIVNRCVVQFRPAPPEPASDYEWIEGTGWQLTQAVTIRAAKIRIVELERNQARAIREYLLGRPGAQERLAALDSQITELAEQSGLRKKN